MTMHIGDGVLHGIDMASATSKTVVGKVRGGKIYAIEDVHGKEMTKVWIDEHVEYEMKAWLDSLAKRLARTLAEDVIREHPKMFAPKPFQGESWKRKGKRKAGVPR